MKYKMIVRANELTYDELVYNEQTGLYYDEEIHRYYDPDTNKLYYYENNEQKEDKSIVVVKEDVPGDRGITHMNYCDYCENIDPAKMLDPEAGSLDYLHIKFTGVVDNAEGAIGGPWGRFRVFILQSDHSCPGTPLNNTYQNTAPKIFNGPTQTPSGSFEWVDGDAFYPNDFLYRWAEQNEVITVLIYESDDTVKCKKYCVPFIHWPCETFCYYRQNDPLYCGQINREETVQNPDKIYSGGPSDTYLSTQKTRQWDINNLGRKWIKRFWPNYQNDEYFINDSTVPKAFVQFETYPAKKGENDKLYMVPSQIPVDKNGGISANCGHY
jgi:hypothetical protein